MCVKQRCPTLLRLQGKRLRTLGKGKAPSDPSPVFKSRQFQRSFPQPVGDSIESQAPSPPQTCLLPQPIPYTDTLVRVTSCELGLVPAQQGAQVLTANLVALHVPTQGENPKTPFSVAPAASSPPPLALA